MVRQFNYYPLNFYPLILKFCDLIIMYVNTWIAEVLVIVLKMQTVRLSDQARASILTHQKMVSLRTVVHTLFDLDPMPLIYNYQSISPENPQARKIFAPKLVIENRLKILGKFEEAFCCNVFHPGFFIRLS